MGERRATFLPGDPVPALQLPDPTGAVVDLKAQSVAGNTLLLWLRPALPDRELALRAAVLLDRLQAVEARLFVVLVGARGPLAAEAGGLAVLTDPESRAPGLFGLEAPGIVVLDPLARVAAVLEGDDLDAALARAGTVHARTSEVVVERVAPAILIADVLQPELCRSLIAFWEGGEKLHDRVASGRAAGDPREQVKRRTDVMLSDKALFETVKQRVQRRVLSEIKRAFAFEVTNLEALRVGCYDASRAGHFGRHRDNSTPFTAHRRFAMSLNLNTGDYEGGELRFPEYGRQLYRPEAGGCVVFSCSLLHEALPVRRGRRFAVFSFFFDAEGARREREMMARQEAAGFAGVEIR